MALADGGTMYLEGIEALSRSAQENLLKVLRDAANQRAAGQQPTPDVRLICYARVRPYRRRTAGRLRRRTRALLGTRRLAVPSLAERRDDVILLANSIVG